MCVYVCMYNIYNVCMYAYVCMYVYVCVYYICMYVCMYVSVNVCAIYNIYNSVPQ